MDDLFEELLTWIIVSYGNMGLLIAMIVQTIIAPIPSELILVMAGAIGIGMVDILIFGCGGLVIGSVIAFFIARKGGRPVLKKMIGEKWTNALDGWVSRRGAKAILISRFIPIVPFDLISYVSGVTTISFRSYFIATVLGAIPRTILLAYSGEVAGELISSLGMGLEVMIAAGIAAIIVFFYLERRGYVKKLERTLLARVVKKLIR